MRECLLILLGISACLFANAQVFNVHHNNGQSDNYSMEDVSSIVFTNHSIEVNKDQCAPDVFSVLFVDYLKFGEALNVNNENSIELSVFPNPVTTSFQIETTSVLTEQAVLLSSSGAVLRIVNLSETREVSMESLPSGIYFLSVNSQYFKIVKL